MKEIKGVSRVSNGAVSLRAGMASIRGAHEKSPEDQLRAHMSGWADALPGRGHDVSRQLQGKGLLEPAEKCRTSVQDVRRLSDGQILWARTPKDFGLYPAS